MYIINKMCHYKKSGKYGLNLERRMTNQKKGIYGARWSPLSDSRGMLRFWQVTYDVIYEFIYGGREVIYGGGEESKGSSKLKREIRRKSGDVAFHLANELPPARAGWETYSTMPSARPSPRGRGGHVIFGDATPPIPLTMGGRHVHVELRVDDQVWRKLGEFVRSRELLDGASRLGNALHGTLTSSTTTLCCPLPPAEAKAGVGDGAAGVGIGR
jgi:hypothetical protein